MRRIVTTLIALCAYSASSHTWADRLAVCKVADPELQGEYVGQCNGWGNAEGYASVQGRASYVGEFKDGKKHGFGVKTWPSGEQYIGQFSDDAKNGYGIYKWQLKGSARDIYVGQFLNDQRQGLGTYSWASGDAYRGEWQGDKFVSTPTPMMQLQAKYEKSLAAAVKQPGTNVCKAVREGTSRTQWLNATVISVHENNLTLQVTHVPPALQGRIDIQQTITDSYLNWEPCAADERPNPVVTDTIEPLRP